MKELTFSRSGGFIEPLAATVAAMASSMESGESNGVPREEMDSPKSDKDEDGIELGFEDEQRERAWDYKVW